MTLSLPAFTQDQEFPFYYLRMGKTGLLRPGTVQAGDMAISIASGFQIAIAAGEAYVQQDVSKLGSFYASRGLYQIFNDGVASPVNAITAPITYPRVDTVIARVYDVYEQALSGNSYWNYQWVTGTETSGATLSNKSGAASSLPANSLVLGYTLSEPGASSINSIQNVDVSSSNNAYFGQSQCTVDSGVPFGSVAFMTGADLTVPVSGLYFVMGTFDLQGTATGWGNIVGECLKNNVSLGAQAVLGDNGATNQRATLTQSWAASCNAGDVLQLAATKTVNAGAAQVNLGQTILTMLRPAAGGA